MEREKQVELYRDLREYCLSLDGEELGIVYDELWAKKDSGKKWTARETYTEQIISRIYEMMQWKFGDCDDLESDI